jgi:hypothetical protein
MQIKLFFFALKQINICFIFAYIYPLNLLYRDDNTDSNEKQNWSRGRMEMLYKGDRPASPGEWSSSWRRMKTPLMEMDFPS